MRHIFKISIFILSVYLSTLLSCNKDLVSLSEIDKPPVANAGPDQTILLPLDSVILNGSASSDADGKISEWRWVMILGSFSGLIIIPSDSVAKVKGLITGTYQFELKVTDLNGFSAKDTMQINVKDPVNLKDSTQLNRPPVANAGADQTITLPENAINLDGSGSTDPDNNIIRYQWTVVSGPLSYNITNANNIQTRVTNLFEGDLLIELKVTDAGGLFSKDSMKVFVNRNSPDPCPIANRPFVIAQLIPVGTLSIPRMQMAVASAGNKLLFAGGYGINHFNSIGGIAFRQVDIYDFITQHWSTAELSLDRGNMGVAVAGNMIFFAGGHDQNDLWLNDHYKRIDIYDASTGTWTIDSLSWPRVSPSGEVIGNKVFFGGGWDWYYGMTEHAKVVDIKDLTSNTWSTTTLSETKAYLSSETMGNKIYFAGGAHGDYFSILSNKVDVYNNSTASWSIETLFEPKEHFASIGFAGKLYWAGGLTGLSPATARKSALVEIKNIATNTSTQACLFQPNALFSAVLKNDRIVFFTGEGVAKNKFDIYDPATNVWSIGVLPVEIHGASIISVKNTIYVAGGYVNNVLSKQVWKLEF